jgi:hypothetical protein
VDVHAVTPTVFAFTAFASTTFAFTAFALTAFALVAFVLIVPASMLVPFRQRARQEPAHVNIGGKF